MNESPVKTIDELPLILKPQDIKKVLRIGNNKVYELLHQPDFPARRQGRTFYVTKPDFVRWLEGNK